MQKFSSRALADKAFVLLQTNLSVEEVKQAVGGDAGTWSRVCALVYANAKLVARHERDQDAKRRHVATTSNADITKLLTLNSLLAKYALLEPVMN